MNKDIFRRSIIILLATIAAAFAVARIYYSLTDDFRLSNITSELPYRHEWSTPTDAAQEVILASILNQPYTYLGKGAQSYVFTSADGKYVLKFFKFKHLRQNFYIDILPDIGPIASYKAKQAARKERKLAGVFTSHLLAYNKHRDESGLIFIQMNTTNNPHRTVTLFDKIGRQYILDLESFPFVLQRRGVPLDTALKSLLDKGDIGAAKEKITKIFTLYAQEYSKGLFDHDHGIDRNTGFIDNNAAHLDVGKLLADESMKDTATAKRDAIEAGNRLKQWISNNFKGYSPVLNRHIDNTINTLFSPPKASGNERKR